MSEKYKAIGTLIKLEGTKQITDKFRKREFVLEIPDGKYPQTIQFQVTGDRCEQMDQYNHGDTIAVEFNLRGREWTKPETGEVKYFNSLDVWRHERVGEPARPVDADADIPF